MLCEMLYLEQYFGTENAALGFEELARRFGPENIRKALESGDLSAARLSLGPQSGALVFWLSERGRARAQAALMPEL